MNREFPSAHRSAPRALFSQDAQACGRVGDVRGVRRKNLAIRLVESRDSGPKILVRRDLPPSSTATSGSSLDGWRSSQIGVFSRCGNGQRGRRQSSVGGRPSQSSVRVASPGRQSESSEGVDSPGQSESPVLVVGGCRQSRVSRSCRPESLVGVAPFAGHRSRQSSVTDSVAHRTSDRCLGLMTGTDDSPGLTTGTDDSG